MLSFNFFFTFPLTPDTLLNAFVFLQKIPNSRRLQQKTQGTRRINIVYYYKITYTCVYRPFPERRIQHV